MFLSASTSPNHLHLVPPIIQQADPGTNFSFNLSYPYPYTSNILINPILFPQRKNSFIYIYKKQLFPTIPRSTFTPLNVKLQCKSLFSSPCRACFQY